MSPRFLSDLLTRTPWQEAIPSGVVLIEGAWIDGDLDLENAKLVRAVMLANSRVEGDIVLRRARTDSLISLPGTFVAGKFDGTGLQSGADLLANGSTFAQGMSLGSAKVGGPVSLVGVTVVGELNCDGLEAHDLLMYSDETHDASFKDVDLHGAKIGGQVNLIGAMVNGPLDGDSLEVHDVLMRSNSSGTATFAGPLLLPVARIGGNLDLSGARLGDSDLSSASIDGLFVVGTASGKQTEWRKREPQHTHAAQRSYR